MVFQVDGWGVGGVQELHVVWVRTSKLGQRLTVKNASHIMDWIKRRATKEQLRVTNYWDKL